MPQPLPLFRVNELYSNEGVYRSLNVGNAGGVRLKRDDTGGIQRMALMTSLPDARQRIENPCQDRIEGDILIYTGAGKAGDQTLGGNNQRIPQQFEKAFPIYGFQRIGSRRRKDIGPRRWRFLGLLEYLRHYPEAQMDARGSIRTVWILELRIHSDFVGAPVTDELAVFETLMAQWRLMDPQTDEAEVDSGVATQTDTEPSPHKLEAIERTLRTLLGYSPVQFEHVIKEFLVQTGFHEVVVTKYRQDGGIDLNAYSPETLWPVSRLLLQVQAKRWLPTVGRKEAAELRGSLRPFALGCVVTTGHFSKAAIREAAEDGKNPIRVVNGFELASIVNERSLTLPRDIGMVELGQVFL